MHSFLRRIAVACSLPVATLLPASPALASQAITATAVCPLPYTLVCDAQGASCECETDPKLSPTLPIKDIGAGGTATYIIKNDGTVWCWGAMDATSSNSPFGPSVLGSATPQPLGVSNAVQLAVGQQGACALLGDGTVSCWGMDSGLCSDPAPVLVQQSPTATNPLTGVVSVSYSDGSAAHGCALLTNASVVCWGDNSYGQLADGTTNPHAAAPIVDPTAAPGTATQVLTAYGNTCVLYGDGHVSCYGDNSQGELGQGSAVDDPSHPGTAPHQPHGVGKVDAIYGGGLGTFCLHQPALGSDGGADEMQCWGDNENNQLTGLPISPVSVAYSPHPSAVTGLTVRNIGAFNGCEWAIDGTPTCWGSEQALGTPQGNTAPRALVGAGNVFQVAMGDSHLCVLNRTGVYCQGDNSQGQLGIGNINPATGFQSVTGISQVTCPHGTSLTCDHAGTANDNCHCSADDDGGIDGGDGGASDGGEGGAVSDGGDGGASDGGEGGVVSDGGEDGASDASEGDASDGGPSDSGTDDAPSPLGIPIDANVGPDAAVPADAAVGPVVQDGGAPDAGATATGGSSGCGCRVGPEAPEGGAAPFTLLGVAALVRLRRRRGLCLPKTPAPRRAGIS